MMKRQEYLISKGCETMASDWLESRGVGVPTELRRGLHLRGNTDSPF